MLLVKKAARRTITLIEIMIVIILIGMLMGALAYQATGYLEQGRKLTAETTMRNVKAYLEEEAARDPRKWNEIESNWQNMVRSSRRFENPETQIVDPWGEEYTVTVVREQGFPEVSVRSRTYDQQYGSDGL